MQTEIIKIDNLKCGGCVNTVTKQMEKIDGIETVSVNLETSTITLQRDDQVSRETIIAKLTQFGYPEMGTTNLIQKAKSYVSCAIGRIDTK